jgi:hypothetical protein
VLIEEVVPIKVNPDKIAKVIGEKGEVLPQGIKANR